MPAGGSISHEPAGGQAHDSAPSQPNAADKPAIQSSAKGSVKEVSAVVPEEEPAIAKKQAKTKGTAKSGETNQAVKLPKAQNAYLLFMKDKKAAIKGELLLFCTNLLVLLAMIEQHVIRLLAPPGKFQPAYSSCPGLF